MLRPNGWTQLDQIWHAGGREGGRGGQGRGGQGRAGQGRGGEGGEGRGGDGRGEEGRGGDCPHFPQTRTFVTALCDRGA